MKQNQEESLQPSSMVTCDLHWEMVPGRHHLLKVNVSRSRPWIPQVSPPGEGNRPGTAREEPVLQVRVPSGRRLAEAAGAAVQACGAGGRNGGLGVEAENRSPRGTPGCAKRYWKKRKISEHVSLEGPLVCGDEFLL